MPGSMGVGVRMGVRVGMRMLLVRMGLGMLELVRDGLVVGGEVGGDVGPSVVGSDVGGDVLLKEVGIEKKTK